MHQNPARKIKPSAVKNICKFPSTKSFFKPSHSTFRMILVESLLEKDFCFHLEFDPNVLSYYPQPKTFSLNVEMLCEREYTPDFVVFYREGRKAYIEVKKDFKSLDEIYLKKLDLASVEMRSDGFDFLRVNEAQIRVEPLLDNLKHLQRYRDADGRHAGTLTLLRNSIRSPKTLRDLLANPLGIRTETIYGLIATGFVKADLSMQKLTLDTEVCYV